jgi:hypothetical protein
MKRIQLAFGALLSCCVASAATGQPLHKIAIEWDISQPAAKQEVDTCVAASATRILVATNQRLALLTRDGTQKDLIEWGEPGSIFQAAGFVDPRVDYDPYSGRLWILMLGSGGFVHLAVSKGSTPEDLTPAHWHVYTGGNEFDLHQIGIGTAYLGGADHAVLSFDPNWIWLTSIDGGPSGVRQGIALFPRTHDGGAKSILEGDRPSEEVDLEGISPSTLNPADNSLYHYAVQEPFESVAAGSSSSPRPRSRRALPWVCRTGSASAARITTARGPFSTPGRT